MPRWLKWVLGIAGGLVVTLVVAVAIFILVFDWNWARDPITKAASDATGREVKIGNIEGEWSLRPRITFQDVHFANAEWSKEPEMFAAEELAITVDLRQLLRRRLVLPNIDLKKPRVVLERTVDGKSNWTFAAKKAADVVKPENRFEMPLIGRLAIEQGALVYRDPKAGIDLDSKISTVVGAGGEGKGQVRIEGKGALHGEPFTLRLLGGSLLMLRETDEPYPLTIELATGTTQAKMSGTLDDPIKFEGLDLNVNLKGDNLARISKLTGVPLPLTPSYDIRARLYREEDIYLLRDIDGTMGYSDLQGMLKIDTSGERPYIEADLRSKTLDYRDVGSLIGIDPAKYQETDRQQQEKKEAAKEDNRQTQSAEIQTRDTSDTRGAAARQTRKAADEEKAQADQRRVLPDAPLAVEQVRNTDAKVKFRGEKVMAPNVPLSGVQLDLEMKNGVLHIKPLTVGVAGGTTIADIKIDATKEMVHTDYDIKLQGYELERFLNDAGLKDAGRGKIYGRVVLSSPGNTLQKSLANANGNMRLVMYGGEISTLAMEAVGVDVAEGLGFLVEGDKPTQIRCMAADMPVESGLISVNFFVLDTADTLVQVEGTGDLAAERLDLRIIAHPKDPSPLSVRTPITVKGTFAQPSIGVEAGPLAARAAGAVALGVLLTPLAAILAFIEPGLEKDSDCAKLLQQATPN